MNGGFATLGGKWHQKQERSKTTEKTVLLGGHEISVSVKTEEMNIIFHSYVHLTESAHS